MKKIVSLLVIVIIIGAVIWKFNSSKYGDVYVGQNATTSAPASQTVVVSDKSSEYKNDELGFSIKYPTSWEKVESPSSILFNIPKDEKIKNTVNSIQAKIDIISGKCVFPPVTTASERDTVKVGDLSFNMLSIVNTVQGRSYFNRLYSLQKDSTCYFFTFSSTTLSPSSKGYAGADAQKIGAQNKTIVDAADTQFKDMVKSFKFIVGPVGQDETQVAPKKK